MAERLRGRAGQVQRLRRLKRTNGLCELCLNARRTRVATVVDHIKPLAHGGSDEDRNTRNLCDEHHRQVTAEQFGHQVARGKRGVDANGKPLDRDHPWSGRAAPDPAPPRRPTSRGVKSG
jgi:5-methylcytosine-specific restriction protein A